MVLSRWVLQLVQTRANTAVIALENTKTSHIILCIQYVVLLLKIESVYLVFAFAVVFQRKYLTISYSTISNRNTCDTSLHVQGKSQN